LVSQNIAMQYWNLVNSTIYHVRRQKLIPMPLDSIAIITDSTL
jgi:hypothetical protein